MSAEIPPDPVTNQFNPAAWTLPALTPEEEAILNSQFVTYPITQSNTITFPTAPIAPTLPDGTNTTQVATTGFVQNAITAFTSTVNTWLGIQIFSVGMTSNTINPTTTSGTLIIGNAAANTNVEVATSASRNVILHLGDGDNNTLNAGIHIGNGATSANNVRILDGAGSTGTIFLGSATSTTSLGCPLTPAYSYPITSGKVGFTTTVTAANVAATQNATDTLVSISLPKGLWFISFTTGLTTSTAGFFRLGISETTNTLTGARALNTFQGTSSIPPNINTSVVLSHNDGVNKTYYGVALYSLTGGTWTGIEMYATRLA